jgi:hypothetical protein
MAAIHLDEENDLGKKIQANSILSRVGSLSLFPPPMLTLHSVSIQMSGLTVSPALEIRSS